MTWNWQQETWPEFTFDTKKLEKAEAAFLHESGIVRGEYRHIRHEDRDLLIVDLISDEALMTSKIEGEYLNRDSLQSSIHRNLGLQADKRKVPPAEAGIAEMMVNLYKTFNEPLSAHMLFAWHELLMQGRRDVLAGAYRIDDEAMQVVSGPIHNPQVRFEAPPAKTVKVEMQQLHPCFSLGDDLPCLVQRHTDQVLEPVEL
jgi:Fic family protein